MPVMEDPVRIAIFVFDVELSAVAVTRAEETARDAAASSEVLDELTSEQMLPARLPISVGIDRQKVVQKQDVSEREGGKLGGRERRTVSIIRRAVAAEQKTGPDSRNEL